MLDINKEIESSILNILLKQIENKKTTHAYLFEITDSRQRMNVAVSFAKMLFCNEEKITTINCNRCSICNNIDNNNFPELRIIEPEGLFIKKEQISELKYDFNKKAINNDKKVYIINNCEMLNKHAANSLLKFLEDPEDNIIAILLTNNIYQVLNTIVSRCQILKINNNDNYNKDHDITTKLKSIIIKDKVLNEDCLLEEKLIKNIDSIFNFLLRLEKVKEKTIVEIENLWHINFSNKDEIIYSYDIMVLIYKDVLNYILNIDLNIFNSYKENIEKIASYNDKEKIIYKIKIILSLKEKILNNINNGLLMDKLIISFSEV